MDVPLKEYLEARLSEQEKSTVALEKLVDAKQKALALAVEKQEAAYDIRFAGVNEWRQTFGDLVNRGASREYVDARLNEILRRQEDIERWQAKTNGQFATWGVALTVLATAIAIVARFVNLGP